MTLTPEDEKQIRLLIRQEINKAFGSIIVAARKTNIKEIRNLAAHTKFIEHALLQGLHQAEAELAGKLSAGNEEDIFPGDERLETYED